MNWMFFPVGPTKDSFTFRSTSRSSTLNQFWSLLFWTPGSRWWFLNLFFHPSQNLFIYFSIPMFLHIMFIISDWIAGDTPSWLHITSESVLREEVSGEARHKMPVRCCKSFSLPNLRIEARQMLPLRLWVSFSRHFPFEISVHHNWESANLSWQMFYISGPKAGITRCKITFSQNIQKQYQVSRTRPPCWQNCNRPRSSKREKGQRRRSLRRSKSLTRRWIPYFPIFSFSSFSCSFLVLKHPHFWEWCQSTLVCSLILRPSGKRFACCCCARIRNSCRRQGQGRNDGEEVSGEAELWREGEYVIPIFSSSSFPSSFLILEHPHFWKRSSKSFVFLSILPSGKRFASCLPFGWEKHCCWTCRRPGITPGQNDDSGEAEVLQSGEFSVNLVSFLLVQVEKNNVCFNVTLIFHDSLFSWSGSQVAYRDVFSKCEREHPDGREYTPFTCWDCAVWRRICSVCGFAWV